MIDEGLFERFPCDAVYAYHNEPGFAGGAVRVPARRHLQLIGLGHHHHRGQGRTRRHATHHGRPDPGRGAPDLALQTLVSREVDPNDMAVVTVGAMAAGEAPNVIPTSAELKLSIRARRPEVRAFLRDRIIGDGAGPGRRPWRQRDSQLPMEMPPCMNDAQATAFARRWLSIRWAKRR